MALLTTRPTHLHHHHQTNNTSLILAIAQLLLTPMWASFEGSSLKISVTGKNCYGDVCETKFMFNLKYFMTKKCYLTSKFLSTTFFCQHFVSYFSFNWKFISDPNFVGTKYFQVDPSNLNSISGKNILSGKYIWWPTKSDTHKLTDTHKVVYRVALQLKIKQINVIWHSWN